MRSRTTRIPTMPAMVQLVFLVLLAFSSTFLLPGVHAQAPGQPVPTSASTTLALASPSASPASTTTTVAPASTQTVSATVSVNSTTPTSTEQLPPAVQTPGPAINPYPAGTVNCLTMPYCGNNNECFVLEDGLVCLDKTLNWGYILSRNDSGIPAVPSWSGPRSQLNDNCTLFQMPKSADKPGLALMVYDLIQGTVPKDLLLSKYDEARTNWYTSFSNCQTDLACIMGKCQPRPTLGQACTSSFQCNAQALGLNELNSPIPTANTTEIRCEYEGGDMSVNTTCQLLHRETNSSRSSFSAWYVILPVVALLVLIYFATVIYQRHMRKQKLRKWSRVVEEDRNDFQMEAYDDIH